MLYITELQEFRKKASKLLTTEERAELLTFLAKNPKDGDIVAGTGGIRKMRWGAGGRGKRGGVRIIYYYHIVGSEIFLITIYAKNEQKDISPKAKRLYKTLIEELIS